MAWARTPKFSQNIYISIKLKVNENQIDQVTQIDVVKKSLQGEGGWFRPNLLLFSITSKHFYSFKWKYKASHSD